MAKKKRTDSDAEPEVNKPQNEDDLVDGGAHKMKKLKEKKKQKSEEERTEAKEIPTVSIAVAGSIIDNTQSFELATRVCKLPLLSYFSVWLLRKFC